MNFHKNFCEPEEELKKLTEVADKVTPLKFIKGNCEYVGVFVIEEIEKITEQASTQCDLISIQLEIRLKEYTGKISEKDKCEKGFRKR